MPFYLDRKLVFNDVFPPNHRNLAMLTISLRTFCNKLPSSLMLGVGIQLQPPTSIERELRRVGRECKSLIGKWIHHHQEMDRVVTKKISDGLFVWLWSTQSKRNRPIELNKHRTKEDKPYSLFSMKAASHFVHFQREERIGKSIIILCDRCTPRLPEPKPPAHLFVGLPKPSSSGKATEAAMTPPGNNNEAESYKKAALKPITLAT